MTAQVSLAAKPENPLWICQFAPSVPEAIAAEFLFPTIFLRHYPDYDISPARGPGADLAALVHRARVGTLAPPLF